MHGQYIRSTDGLLVNKTRSYGCREETWKWNSGSIRPGITNKVSCNKNIAHRNSKYRLCQQFDETIDHNTSARPILAKEKYIKRHVRVCVQIHLNICKELCVQLDEELWYEHVPESVYMSHDGMESTSANRHNHSQQ